MRTATDRQRPATTITRRNQVTIPADVLRSAGLGPGDRVIVHADGPGRVLLVRERDLVEDFAGSLTGVSRAGELDTLRDEWP